MNRAVRGHPKQIIVKSSDKTWSTGGGNGSPLQYSCCENSMNSMKMQKDMTQKDEPPSSEGVQYASKKVLVLVAQLWMRLLVKVKSDAVMNKIIWEAGMLGP